MFEIGWTEMLVIAVVMIVVVGPKDLPRMLRTFGRMTAKLRGMAGDFQKQFNDAIKEAELDDVKKSVDQLRSLNPAHEIRKQLHPFEKAAADVRAGVDAALKPTPKPEALPDTHPAEPLKAAGTETALPATGPSAMPAAPVFPGDPNSASAASALVAAASVPSGLTAPAETPPSEAIAAETPLPATPLPANATRKSASRTPRAGKPAASTVSDALNESNGVLNGGEGGFRPANGAPAASRGLPGPMPAGPAEAPVPVETPARAPRPRKTAVATAADPAASLGGNARSDSSSAGRPRASRKPAERLP